MSSEPVRRALPPSVFARLADATRYVITGVSPETWFGPLQPLAPTQSEPPFQIAQLALLLVFIILGFLAVRKFHPERVGA